MSTFVGKIISVKMQNTVVVEREISRPHPLYKKLMRKNRHILADTNKLQLSVGDMVKIVATRPISKKKHFKVVEKV